jgi:ribosomal protein L40E
MAMQDYYDRLGVSSTATAQEITDAYLEARARLLDDGSDSEPEEGSSDVLDSELRELDVAYISLLQSGRLADGEMRDTPKQEMVEAPDRNVLAQFSISEDTSPQRRCPHCGEVNPIQAAQCLSCGQQISRPCPRCGFRVNLKAQVCPRCHVVIHEYDEQRFAEAMAVEKRTQEERRASHSRVQALEAVHRANARLGLLFWLIVLVVSIGLCVGFSVLYSYLLQNGFF